MTYESWRCLHCWAVCKATANNCWRCGASWEDYADPDYVPQERLHKQRQQQQEQTQQSHYADYGAQSQANSWNRRPSRNARRSASRQNRQNPKSPRRATHSDSGKGKGKDLPTKGGKGKGKLGKKGPAQKGAPADEAYAPGGGKAPPPEPPWNSSSQSSALSPLPPPTTPPPLSPSEEKLNHFISEMKKQPVAVQENLTPEMKAIVQSASLVEGQKASDTLFAAVDNLSQAREALDQARLGRHQLHVRWRDFLSAAVSRWQEYTQDFQKEEKEYMEAIEQAKQALELARKSFADNKAKLEVDADCFVVEAENADKKVVKEDPSGAALQHGLASMTEHLANLKSSAEALVEEEQAHKRQRTDPGETPMETGGFGNAMEAFPERSSFQAPGKQ
eukprot:s1433_g8.t1